MSIHNYFDGRSFARAGNEWLSPSTEIQLTLDDALVEDIPVAGVRRDHDELRNPVKADAANAAHAELSALLNDGSGVSNDFLISGSPEQQVSLGHSSQPIVRVITDTVEHSTLMSTISRSTQSRATGRTDVSLLIRTARWLTVPQSRPTPALSHR